MDSLILDYGGALDYGVPAGTYYSDPSGEIEALTAKLEAAESEARRQMQHVAATLQKLEVAEKDLATAKGLLVSGWYLELFEESKKKDVQIKALEKDAARYRWLKENKARNNTHCWHFQQGSLIPGLQTLDAAIDAAILGDSHV